MAKRKSRSDICRTEIYKGLSIMANTAVCTIELKMSNIKAPSLTRHDANLSCSLHVYSWHMRGTLEFYRSTAGDESAKVVCRRSYPYY